MTFQPPSPTPWALPDAGSVWRRRRRRLKIALGTLLGIVVLFAVPIAVLQIPGVFDRVLGTVESSISEDFAKALRTDPDVDSVTPLPSAEVPDVRVIAALEGRGTFGSFRVFFTVKEDGRSTKPVLQADDPAVEMAWRPAVDRAAKRAGYG